MGEEKNDLGWVLIPPAVLAREDLCMGEKVLWGRINGLIGKRGYCYATNGWLGQQLGYSPRTIEDYIAKLVQKDCLRREFGLRGKQDRRLYPIPEIAGLLPWNSRDASLKEQGSNIGKSGSKSNKNTSASTPRFPAEWYRQNEEDYQQIKGLQLSGPEFGPLQRDLKLIYKAGHKPADVRRFMEALERSDEDWTDNWTIKTIRMKLAEWKAGKLKLHNGRDDERLQALRDEISEINHYLEYRVERRLIELGNLEAVNGNLTEKQVTEQESLVRIRTTKQTEREKLQGQIIRLKGA